MAPSKDVHFDEALAQAAIDELNGTISLLTGHTTTDLANADRALLNWRGPHARTFQGRGRYPWIRDEATALVSQMRYLVQLISGAKDAAAAKRRQLQDPP